MPLRIWEFVRQHVSLELLITAFTLLVALPPGIFYAGRILRFWRERRAKRRLREKGCNPDVVGEIKENYIRPDCQSVDPADSGTLLEHSPIQLGPIRWLRELLVNPLARPCGVTLKATIRQQVGGHRHDLFVYIDRHLQEAQSDKFILLLADTGMGKTTFLVSYFAHRLLSRQRDSIDVEYLPLSGSDDALRRIRDFESRSPGNAARTVLLLDGLDDDPLASQDPCARLLQVLNQSQHFYRAIVTCRTQLFGQGNTPPTDSRVSIRA